MNDKTWVIRKKGYFYRPDRAGYTKSINEAGRYTEQEAKAEATIEPWCMSAHPASYFERQHDPRLPAGAATKNGRVYNARGELIEIFEGQWRVVKDGRRIGWWRYNEHYDRDGYCDNPARGY